MAMCHRAVPELIRSRICIPVAFTTGNLPTQDQLSLGNPINGSCQFKYLDGLINVYPPFSLHGIIWITYQPLAMNFMVPAFASLANDHPLSTHHRLCCMLPSVHGVALVHLPGMFGLQSKARRLAGGTLDTSSGAGVSRVHGLEGALPNQT